MKREALIVGGVVLAVVGVALLINRGSDGDPVYLTAPVERGKVMTTVTATGTLKAVVTVKVSSQLSGQVAELYADFNDRVTKGQPIARLDQSILAAKVREAKAALRVAQAQLLLRKAAVEKAEADLASARAGRSVVDRRTKGLAARLVETKRDFRRKESLIAKGSISQRDVDRARAAYLEAASALNAENAQMSAGSATILSAQASLRMAGAEVANRRAEVSQREAQLEQAEIELARTVIRSPIDGVVVGRKVDRGQTVATSLEAPTLFEIAQDLRRMELHARIDEADIGRIRVAHKATFRVDAFPGRRFTGRVTQIRNAPEVVKNVVTYTVVISAENPDLLLLPGMTALVRIVVRETNEVLKLPNAALRFRPPGRESASATARDKLPEGSRGTKVDVWVLGDDGEPRRVRVRLGLSDATVSEIVEGPLRKGQKVLVGTVPGDGKRRLFGLRLGF